MKKFLSLALVMIMALSFVACSKSNTTDSTTTKKAAETTTNAPADTGKTYTFKLCDTQPETSVIIQVCKIFGDKMKEKSNGRMTLEIYPASQFGNAITCTQMLQTGDLTFFRNDASAIYDFGVDSHKVVSLPYLFKDSESAYEIMTSEIGDQLKQDTKDADLGFLTLGWLVDTNRNFFTAKTPINKYEDMNGLKIRSLEASIYVDYKSSLGLNPTPMAFSEVYTSLSTGVINAAANTLDSFMANKFYEVCDYYIMNDGMVPVYEMMVSSVIYNSLSDEDQAILDESWEEASAQYLPLAREKQAEQILFCEEQGVTFCDPADEDVWAEACEWLFEKYAADYDSLIKDIKNFK